MQEYTEAEHKSPHACLFSTDGDYQPAPLLNRSQEFWGKKVFGVAEEAG